MLLLLNTDTGMDGGSGDVECEGMTIDGDEYMGNDVDVDEGKLRKAWSLTMSVRTVRAVQVLALLKAWALTRSKSFSLWPIN
jgi:hypothetical protein